MKAKAFYITMSDAAYNEINAKGWNSEAGTKYLNAKEGKVPVDECDLFELAAVVEADDAEQVWCALQNNWAVWSESMAERNILSVHTKAARSMDVGDYIEWENGTRERVARFGFEKV